MIYEITELAKEVLYGVFGNVVYEVGMRPLALMVISPFVLIFLYVLYRFIRRTILQPISANSRKIDQIAITVAENNRMLKALTSCKEAQTTDGE